MIRRGEGEAEPQAGEPVDLAEGAQDDRAARRQDRGEAAPAGVEVGESLVDDQQAAAGREFPVQREQSRALDDPAVGIVGIDDDRDVEGGEFARRGDRLDPGPGGAPGLCMAADS